MPNQIDDYELLTDLQSVANKLGRDPKKGKYRTRGQYGGGVLGLVALATPLRGNPIAPVGVPRVVDALGLVERDAPRNTSAEIGARTLIYQQ